MPEIQKIDDAYIDAVIKATEAYDPNLDVTQGIRLRELIKLMRDHIEQQGENGATGAEVYNLKDALSKSPTLPDQYSKIRFLRALNGDPIPPPNSIYKTVQGDLKYVLDFGTVTIANNSTFDFNLVSFNLDTENQYTGDKFQSYYEILSRLTVAAGQTIVKSTREIDSIGIYKSDNPNAESCKFNFSNTILTSQQLSPIFFYNPGDGNLAFTIVNFQSSYNFIDSILTIENI